MTRVAQQPDGNFDMHLSASPIPTATLTPEQARTVSDELRRQLPVHRWHCTSWSGIGGRNADDPLIPTAHCGFSRCKNSLTLPTFPDNRVLPEREQAQGAFRFTAEYARLAPDEAAPLPNGWMWLSIWTGSEHADKFFCSWRCVRLEAHHHETHNDYLY